MGEEAKQEQAPAVEEKPKAAAEGEKTGEGEKKEETTGEGEKKTGEEKEEKKAEGEKKEEEPPKPPSPFVLHVDLHCVGCAKKIERSIMRLRGVEKVTMDMVRNQVTIKGVVEPQAVCAKVTKKTKRSAKVLSPLPAAEGDPLPEVVSSQVSGLTTVELNVNMHCEACAAQLKKKILKMRGVRAAETELGSGKVRVTGTMDANKLVDYVYRRTKKQARIVPQPDPPAAPEKKEEEAEKPAEEAKPPAEEEKKEEKKEEEKEEEKKEEPKKEQGETKEEKSNGEENKGGGGGGGGGDQKEEETVVNSMNLNEEETMKRMMHYYHYQPLYVIERIPPPQLFSDENPNACCIS